MILITLWLKKCIHTTNLNMSVITIYKIDFLEKI